MIGIEGQYALSIEIGGDFDISEDQFGQYKLVSSASLLLPRFDLTFRTGGNVLSALEKGAKVVAKVGADQENMVASTLRPMKLQVARHSQGEAIITIKGFVDRLPFLKHTGVYATKGKKSGIEAIIEVCGENGIPVDASLRRSEDSQLWCQGGRTLRRFIQDTWLHSRLGDSVPCLGWTCDGTLLIRDLRKQLSSSKRQVGITSDTAIRGDYEITDRSGFVETIAGSEQGFFEIRAGEDDGWLMESASGLSVYDYAPPSKMTGQARLTGNMDPNYWQTYLNNVSTLYHSSSVGVQFVTETTAFDFELLDGFQFFDETGEGSETSTSGSYILTKKTLIAQDRAFFFVGSGVRSPILSGDQ